MDVPLGGGGGLMGKREYVCRSLKMEGGEGDVYH